MADLTEIVLRLWMCPSEMLEVHGGTDKMLLWVRDVHLSGWGASMYQDAYNDPISVTPA